MPDPTDKNVIKCDTFILMAPLLLRVIMAKLACKAGIFCLWRTELNKN